MATATYTLTEEFIKNCPDKQIINAMYCLQHYCEAPAIDYVDIPEEKQVVYKIYLWEDNPNKYLVKCFPYDWQ